MLLRHDTVSIVQVSAESFSAEVQRFSLKAQSFESQKTVQDKHFQCMARSA